MVAVVGVVCVVGVVSVVCIVTVAGVVYVVELVGVVSVVGVFGVVSVVCVVHHSNKYFVFEHYGKGDSYTYTYMNTFFKSFVS